MKVVIDISEEDYKGICHLKNEQLRMLPEEVAETLIRIKNSTPLPKGHGRLIDVDALEEKVEKHRKMLKISEYDRDLILHYTDVEMAPTVIKADTGDTEC